MYSPPDDRTWSWLPFRWRPLNEFEPVLLPALVESREFGVVDMELRHAQPILHSYWAHQLRRHLLGPAKSVAVVLRSVLARSHGRLPARWEIRVSSDEPGGDASVMRTSAASRRRACRSVSTDCADSRSGPTAARRAWSGIACCPIVVAVQAVYIGRIKGPHEYRGGRRRCEVGAIASVPTSDETARGARNGSTA